MRKEKIITSELCCGCKACVQICSKNAIVMRDDKEGFWYPHVDMKKCVDCGLCQKVCPANYQSFSIGMPQCIYYYTKDEDRRLEYSSGGAFSRICKSFIGDKTSYAIYGATLTENNIVKHISIESLNDLSQLSRSKYVQSDTEGVFNQVKKDLKNGKYVIFSGTPCQVQALKNFIGKGNERLLLIDFICHGVPSPMAYKKYCDSMERKYAKRIKKVLFRYKQKVGVEQTWDTQGIKILFDDGTCYCNTTSRDAFMKAYLNEMLSRPSCSKCKFTKLERPSDLTLGDFWGIEKEYPGLSIKETAGTSLVLLNTMKGKSVIDAIKDTLCNEVLGHVDVNIGIDKNIPLNSNIPANLLRDKFYVNLLKRKWSFEECFEYTLYPRGNIIKRMLRKFFNK